MHKHFIERLVEDASKQSFGIYDLEIHEMEAGLFPGSSSITHSDCCGNSGYIPPACFGGGWGS